MIEEQEQLVGREALVAILLRLKDDQDRQDKNTANITPQTDDVNETLYFGKEIQLPKPKRTIRQILDSL